MTPLSDLFAEYVAKGCSPYTDRPWRSSTRIQIEDNLARALRGHEDDLALDLDRALCDRMRAQAGTPNMVRINTTALRAFLLWGYRHSPGYFTAEQVEYLSPGVVMPRPALAGTPAPRRRGSTRRVGQSGDYVEDEDVLAYPDADALPSLHILSGELRLSFHATRSQTTIAKPFATASPADQRAVEAAVEKLRQIIRARQVRPLESLRQRCPGKLLTAALFSVPALLLVGGQPVLDLWFTSTTSQAVAGGLVWLCFVPLLLISGKPKDLIRLRGRELPWTERRQGLIALVGLVLAVVIPSVIFGLESSRG